ncbi:major facilitator superfamily domain-containing protein [Hyaloraphidium curvatum]|nr:major facilitator superfamily domain-containing protein [Hyaloraphidium curvatum]
MGSGRRLRGGPRTLYFGLGPALILVAALLCLGGTAQAASKIKSFFNDVGDKVKGGLKDAGDAVKGGLKEAKEGLENLGDRIESGARQAKEYAKAVRDCARKRGDGQIDQCGWDGKRYRNRACMVAARVGRVKDGACPNFDWKLPTAPPGKSNWASDYYPRVSLKFSPLFPLKAPYTFRPMPECSRYAYADALNNPAAFDQGKGIRSNENTYMMLQLATSAYWPLRDEPLRAWWTCLGAREVELVMTQNENEVVLLRTDSTVIVVFQGSMFGESIISKDWVSNFDMALVSARFFGSRKARIHEGFGDAVRDVVEKGGIVPKLETMCSTLEAGPADCPIMVGGHSRGAALAQLFAAYLVRAGWKGIAGVFSFGGPKPGDAAFRSHYDRTLRLADRSLRVYFKRDAVSATPPLGDFDHVGTPFAAETCLRGEPEADRDFGNPLDHFPHRSLLSLWAVCPTTPGGLDTKAVPPPPYPEGASGMGARTNKKDVAFGLAGQVIGRYAIPALRTFHPVGDAETVAVEDDTPEGRGQGDAGTEMKMKEAGQGAGGDAEVGVDTKEVEPGKPGTEGQPPDGGYGWVVVCCSFLIQAFTLGLQTSWGPFQRYFTASGTFGTTSNVQIAFVSSIATAVTFLFGPLMGALAERVGFRIVAASGSVIILIGIMLASICTAVWQLYLTYGLIGGIGAAASYIPAVGSVPTWFRKRLGLAIGLSVAGGGIGALILNPVAQALLDKVGWAWTFRILGFIASGVGLVGAAFLKTFGTPPRRPGGLKNMLDFQRFKDFTFARLFGVAFFSGMGYFVPFAYLVPYAGTIGISASDASVISGLTNGFGAIGRIVMGFFADRAGSMNTWVAMFYTAALSILVVWTNAKSYGVLLFFGLLWGFAAGAYVSLYGMNTAIIWGPQGQASLLGLLYTGLIPGALVGPVIAGAIVDASATVAPDGTMIYNYIGLQLYSGFCVLTAATVLFWIRLEFGAKKGGQGAGDHISVPFDQSPLVRHHLIYCGNDRVVHYRREGIVEQSFSGYLASRSEFARGLLVHPHPDRKYSRTQTVARARSRIGESKYDLLTNNCEHFCNWAVDGVAISYQVNKGTANAVPTPVVGAAGMATMTAAGAGAFTAATGGAGMMSTLATVGGAVGGGAVAGLGILGGAGGGIGAFVANSTIFADSPEDSQEERNRKEAGRVGSTVGAVAGTAASLVAVSAAAAAGTAGGAALTSGLAGIGAVVGGGMAVGAATVMAAPAVIALGVGALFYSIFD